MGEVNDKNCMMDKSFIIKLFLEQSLERIKLFFLGHGNLGQGTSLTLYTLNHFYKTRAQVDGNH